MTTCTCGNAVEADGTRCARCNALRALELKTDATSAEIHNAYEVLSKAWNPERFEDNSALKNAAEERSREIDAAYALLVRGSVQSTPFRSQPQSEPATTFSYTEPEPEQPRDSRKTKKLEYSETATGRLHFPRPLLIGCGVLLAAVLTGWILFEPLDSALMRMPVAGKVYADYKASIRSGIQRLKNKAGFGVGSEMRAPAESASKAAPDQQVAETENQGQQDDTRRITLRPGTNHPAAGRVLPLITAGMTKSEVMVAQGAPTAETADELDYGNSKLYFGDGGLVGWNIDPSSPLRVKLWPDAAVDPNLRWFGKGSTKNDVIAVQGTPTTFSQNTFGYGASEVYFKNGRVVDWKSDPATPLHATPR